MFPEPTEFLLIGYLAETIWTPKSKSNILTPINQLADMLTEGSFTLDEWDHLLRSVNIMNFSVFPAAIFFQTEKQSVVSKRAQESTAKEGSAVAKPRPMSLVSRNLLSVKKTPPLDSSASALEIKSWIRVVFHRASGTGAKQQDPPAYSQERRQDDTPSSSTRRLVRGDDSQIERTRLELHNVQISDHRYLEKVFKNLRQKLNLAEEAPLLDLRDLCVDLVIIYFCRQR